MPSFKQLMASHGTLLILDAASSVVHAGLVAEPRETRWASEEGEASVALFRATQRLAADIAAVDAFVYCDGPGSILGIRNVAMCLRAWCVLRSRPVYAYSSLEIIAASLGRSDVTVIADARRQSWHACRMGTHVRRVSLDQLSPPLVAPESFRSWSPLPEGVEKVAYNVPTLISATSSLDLLRMQDAPDAFLHEEPAYVTWEPQIHRAPSSP